MRWIAALLFCQDESWVNPPKDAIPGVAHASFASASMKREVGYNIYLPPDYSQGDRRYPVAYYMPGMTDSESMHIVNVKALDDALKNIEKVRGKMPIRVVVGAKDGLVEHNRKMHQFLTDLKIEHEYEEVEGVGHNPQQM